MNKKYSGFTLVEMLIVMGIIIILTVVGITAGRFAINRANDVAHRNAVDQVYTSLQAYYTDEREYPINGIGISNCVGTICSLKELVGDQDDTGLLVPYIDANSFDGGTTASYFYGVGGDGGNQAVLICVTLRGPSEDNYDHPDGAVYCAGNGIGAVDPAIQFENGNSGPIPIAEMTYKDYNGNPAWAVFQSGGSEWDNGWK
jgi:type II secretory pathway pseudopilin PulG